MKKQQDPWTLKSLPSVTVSKKRITKDAPAALANLENLQGHLKLKEYQELLGALGLDEWYQEA